MNPKDFMQKWKKGIMLITPEQRLKNDLVSLFFIVIGNIIAAFMFLFFVKSYWWLSIIFGFSSLLTISQFIAKFQEYNLFKDLREGKLDEKLMEIEKENNDPKKMV